MEKLLAQRPLWTERFRRFPVNINIEPTNACNLKCVMCPREEGLLYKGAGMFNFDLYKKVIDEARHYRNITLTLHKDGEPLMHPRIMDMIRYAKAAGCYVSFNSNALLMDEKKARALIESGLDYIGVSINAASEGTFIQIQGMPGLNIVEKNVMRLLELKKEMDASNPIVEVRIIEMQAAIEEIPAFKKKWDDVADKVKTIKFSNWNGSRTDTLEDKGPTNRYPCPFLWSHASINWNGDVNICCQDYRSLIVLGNVANDSLKNIWNGKKMQEIRDYHMKNQFDKVPICRDCNFWSHRRGSIFFKNPIKISRKKWI